VVVVKKGQITVFIILGILLLVAFSMAIFVMNFMTTADIIEEQGDYSTTDSIQLYIESCLETAAVTSLVNISSYGGYYNLPLYSTTGAYINVPYFIRFGTSYLPESVSISENTEHFFEDAFDDCIDLEIFDAYTFSGELEYVEVSINDDSVDFDLYYPLVAENLDGSQTEFSLFSTNIDANLLIMFNIASEITNNQLEHAEYVCISCLALLGNQYQIDITTVDTIDGTYFQIEDPQFEEQYGEVLMFRFIHKYYD
tara:strand:- start:1200 stop:1964 length:765 start_codon:yes stop_codon:yes gene_type:complete